MRKRDMSRETFRLISVIEQDIIILAKPHLNSVFNFLDRSYSSLPHISFL